MAYHDEWWWQPLPQWITDILSSQEIASIYALSDEKLIAFHNRNNERAFERMSDGDKNLMAKIYVAQGECWRRGFETCTISVRIAQ